MEVLQDFNITNLNNFLKCLIFFHVFDFFRQQGNMDLLQGLIISCCIVSRVNGMVSNIFSDSSFSSFWIKFIIQFLENFLLFQVYGSL